MSKFTHNPDNLIAGSFPVKTGEGTLLAGQGLLKRGSVLGVVTASGLLKLCNSLSNDGSQTPNCILAQDTLVLESNVPHVPIYLSGDFESSSLIFGGTDTVNTHQNTMRSLNMYTSTGSDQYGMRPPRVEPPSFKINETPGNPSTVSISSFNGSTTLIRINGSSWVPYVAPLPILEAADIEAYSKMDGYSDSIIVSIHVIPKLNVPTFNPIGGEYTEAKTVSITFDANATTKEYSLDGEEWTPYTVAVEIAATGSLYARCSADGFISSSAVAEYTITE